MRLTVPVLGLHPNCSSEGPAAPMQAVIWQALELQGSAEAALTQEFSHRVTQASATLSENLQQSGKGPGFMVLESGRLGQGLL